ncbi:hypothetical protein [Clostridium sporogenes]|uniref:hypothetical protein n=1 Tax=Clostridium sporogenes TaxID=1509 RepID=UPI0013D4267F|nr:hypothetical protein [Clostridium sporogenes]
MKEAMGIKRCCKVITQLKKLFISWRRETETVLFKIFGDNKNGKLFLIKTDKDVNKFSKVHTINILTEGTNRGIDFIQELI